MGSNCVKSPYPDIDIPIKSFSDHAFSQLQGFGDAVALIDNANGQSITFREFELQARKCASSLFREGLRHGDVLGMCTPNCLEFPTILLATNACGATFTSINPGYKKGEILQQFEISRPKIVIVANEVLPLIKAVAKEIDCIQKIFTIGHDDEFVSFRTLVDLGDVKDFPQDIPTNPKEDIAILPYSSGTTGLPKSVMLTNYNVVAAMTLFGFHLGLSETACIYSDRPMYHLGGFRGPWMMIQTGCRCIIEKQCQVERLLEAIQTYRVTHLNLVPPIAIDMARTRLLAEYDTSSLKQIFCTGAGVAPQIMKTLEKRYDATVSQAYGLTEAVPVTCGVGLKKSMTSVGSISANNTIKIVDFESGKALGPNQRGEIVVKGPHVMKGYLKNPEATANALEKGGWLHTGDIGYYDKDEMLYVVDRLKEVIKYKTFQVPPAEIEAVLLSHPHVADVGVIGVPDEYVGEIPLAFVVQSDEALTEIEVMDYVAEHLADYKHLRGGVNFTNVIPRSPTGKIIRKELKNMAEDVRGGEKS